MKLRTLLATAAVGLGAVVAGNRALAARAPELEPPLSGRQRTYRWRGMDVAYVEAGDPDDETVVMLHGINAAGSAGEFRRVFDDLASEYHVVAPDLPGFGRSDRPALRYSAALYEDFVADFLAEFDTPRVVASSLTGAYAAVAVDRDDLAVADLTLICPTTVAGPEPPAEPVRELLRLPVVGEALFNLIGSRPSIRYFNADHGYFDPAYPESEWEDYEWTTAHQESARFAPASFVSGYLNSDADLAAILADRDAPVRIVWGREADITPLAEGRDLAADSGAELVVFDAAKLLPHVEFGDQFGDLLTDGTVDEPAMIERDDRTDGDSADEN